MVSLPRLSAVARKESVHLLRDWRSLGLAVVIPILLILLFGYALNLDVRNVPVVVWDQSGTPQSREFLSLFDGSPYFTIVAHHDNYRDLQHDLDRARAMIAVVVPADFAAATGAQREVSVQVIADGSDANTARLVLGYAQGLALAYNRRLLVNRAQLMGRDNLTAPVEVVARAFYNPELRSANNIIPGIIAIVMMVIAALLTSITVAREWEQGTMEQLISTPVRVPELVLGKLAPYFVIGFLDVVLAVAVGLLVFNVPLRGSALLVFVMAAIFLVGALCTGIAVSIAVKKQVLSIQIALIGTFLPTMLLSGFVFAIENMPRAIQYLTYLVPARYFISLLRGVYLKGIGLQAFWFYALLLTLWALIMLVVAHRRMRLKLE